LSSFSTSTKSFSLTLDSSPDSFNDFEAPSHISYLIEYTASNHIYRLTICSGSAGGEVSATRLGVHRLFVTFKF
jgi:hypothetical protein